MTGHDDQEAAGLGDLGLPNPERPASREQPVVKAGGADKRTRIQSAAAIRADTQRWEETKDVLSTAAQLVDAELSLTEEELSGIGSATGTLSTYRSFHEWYVGLLRQGADQMDDMVDRLVDVSRRIEAAQEENLAEIDKIAAEMRRQSGG